jgi:hypothetical protein
LLPPPGASSCGASRARRLATSSASSFPAPSRCGNRPEPPALGSLPLRRSVERRTASRELAAVKRLTLGAPRLEVAQCYTNPPTPRLIVTTVGLRDSDPGLLLVKFISKGQEGFVMDGHIRGPKQRRGMAGWLVFALLSGASFALHAADAPLERGHPLIRRGPHSKLPS